MRAVVETENDSCQKIQVTPSIGSYLSLKCLIFRAYMKSIEEQGPEPRLPGLTQSTTEQLFFVSFSQVSMILISTPPMALSMDVFIDGRRTRFHFFYF